MKIMMEMMEDMIFHFNLELILMENHDGNWNETGESYIFHGVEANHFPTTCTTNMGK